MPWPWGTSANPSAMLADGLRPVMSRPSKWTRPALALISPKMVLQQGGLPCPVMSEHDDDLAGLQFEVDGADHRLLAVAGHQAGGGQDRGHWKYRRTSSGSRIRVSGSPCASARPSSR